jgi:RNA polymerase sigma-70 factor, ECF subfamily
MCAPAIYFRRVPRDTIDIQVRSEGARVGRREGEADMDEGTNEPLQRPPVATASALAPGPEGDSSPATPDELTLLAALRGGDEAAFETLVNAHYPAMLRVALMYVRNRSVAEEVIQETWLAVLQGLARFEGRSSLKTWIFRILANRARTRAVREGRSVPFSALVSQEAESDEPAVEPERFRPVGDQWPGGWVSAPQHWGEVPEERMLALETRQRLRRAIEALPPAQRAVITLRDIEGWDAAEVSGHLGVTDGNQRVLLHRARSKVRAALEHYLAEV